MYFHFPDVHDQTHQAGVQMTDAGLCSLTSTSIPGIRVIPPSIT
ncbi:hypothetical protein [Undibacterium sp. 14-3-2]|nr:hypothetical protein [Undibacterium sp. 14-3-2]